MKFLANIDLVKNQILNAVIQLLGSDPSGTEGQIYHNSSTHIPKVHNGTSWQQFLLENRIGAASGVAGLDSGGKIPMAQIPSSVANGMDYKGTHDASGGTAPTATKIGDFWIISVAGTISSVSYGIGDWIVSRDGSTTWDKIDNTDAVATVFGRTGTVVATAGDYTATQITNTPAGNIAATTVQAALNELDSEKEPVISSKKTAFNVDFETTATNIKMDGTQSLGALSTVARADHVHPTDTSRQATLVSGTTIKTINGTSVLGSGDIVITSGATKFTQAVGDGSSTSITVTHNLNTRDIIVQLYEASGSYNNVMCDVAATTLNTATLAFAVAPTAGQYRVVII